ncbi:putative uncharacterized protein C8orf44 [Plecturocebus cupreus]
MGTACSNQPDGPPSHSLVPLDSRTGPQPQRKRNAQETMEERVKMGFHHVDQDGFKLLISSEPYTLASQSAGITGAIYNSKTGWAQWVMPVIPALWEVKVGGSLEARSSRPTWPTRGHPVSTKNTKIIWAWWCMPVSPTTQEAEAQESLELRQWRLQRDGISAFLILFPYLSLRAKFQVTE